MKEHQILFSAPMVRALLAGTKSQTRRVVKPEGAHRVFQFRGTTAAAGADEPTGEWGWCGSERVVHKHIRCPYGIPGDRLWVREAFIHEPADYCWEASVSIPCRPACTVYRADHTGDTRGAGWKPSIHMPRSLSRILLEVTDVRVERLQDISEADAIAEGAPCYVCGAPLDGRSESDCHCFHRKAAPSDYRALWEQINGRGSWDANPFVWCVSFKRIGAQGVTE